MHLQSKIETLASAATPSFCSEIQAELPQHLIRTSQRPWAFWRWVCLRGAGFPSHLVSGLAASQSAMAADRFLAQEEELTQAANEVAIIIRSELEATRDADRRKFLVRSLKSLDKGRLPESLPDSAGPARERYLQAARNVEQLREHYRRELEIGVAGVSQRIREIATDPRFRIAVLLQNRSALHSGVDLLLRPHKQGAKRDKKERQHEELVASYLQRYCLKNDTVGFFGPVGWVKLVPETKGMIVRPGADLTSNSSLYFENWPIDALADKLSQDQALLPWIAPRTAAHFYLRGDRLYLPGGASSVLSAAQAFVLRRCDAQRTARQIVMEAVNTPGSRISTEQQAYDILHFFSGRGIIFWKFEVPFTLYPERWLRALIERIEQEELRTPALDALNELERARENVSRTMHDVVDLDRTLGELDATFTRLTGQSPTRSPGSMYAARTLVYQECYRDLDMQIGPDILALLETPLSLLLSSARWLSYRAGVLFREACNQIYAEIISRNAGRPVDLLQFWFRVEPLIFSSTQRLLNRVAPEFVQKWERILRISPGQQRVNYTSEELRPLVEAEFAASAPGWQLACYHSPDVMIAASSLEAISRRDFFFVLGEVHITANTVKASFAVSQHPCPAELFQATRDDLPGTRMNFVPPKSWPKTTNRTSNVLGLEHDYYLEATRDAFSSAARSQVIPISALLVEKSAQGLIVRTRDGHLKFDIVHFFGEPLSIQAVEFMKIMHPGRHSPRVSVDRLVIARESWSFSPSELEFVRQQSETDRFLDVRRWMHQNNLPRFVFVRVPVEVKPFYVDFDSPIFVEIFIKMVRRLVASDKSQESVTISEMLPAPDQLWLPDRNGHTYTSELRMVTKDLADRIPLWQ
jgi:hypothetical protein